MPKKIRKLTRSGSHSYYVRLSPEFIRDLKWRERQKVVVKKVGKRLVVEDWPVQTVSPGLKRGKHARSKKKK